jgi:hypothetical protein
MDDDNITPVPSLEEIVTNERLAIEKKYSEFSPPNLKRHKPTLLKLTAMAWPIMKITSWKHYEIPKNSLNLIKSQRKYDNCIIAYDGLHRSLAEVVMDPYAINIHGGNITSMMMGNNLLRKDAGKRERRLAFSLERANVVALVERLKNKMQQADRVAFDMYTRLTRDICTFVYPGGTRSRDGSFKKFYSAAYQGMIDAAKVLRSTISPSKDKLLYLIHVNVDYSKTLEVREFVAENHDPNKPHSFSMRKDLKKFFKNPGHVYVSFSEPILIHPYDDRKKLAERSMQECLDLVKILPINIMSEAMIRLNPTPGSVINKHRLYGLIDDVIDDLSPHQHKFRRVTIGNAEKIVSRSRLPLDSRLMDMYKVYANYIGHYMPEK